MKNKNIIPLMINPLGSCWRQPNTNRILVDDNYAVMGKLDFDMLMDYTRSQPTGLYDGKMWKAQYWENNKLEWYLCYCNNENVVTNEIDICYREILTIN
ncbi:MAG: hypothetical protein H6Q13_3175 [Bacteroidetes bacterium]|nr:hypothetical protein [Bacteroidota bacterium]